MPHSPRWHQGKLWVLNSGTGYLGTVDIETGKFDPLVFCPGFAIPGVRQPMALGFVTDEIHKTISIEMPAKPI